MEGRYRHGAAEAGGGAGEVHAKEQIPGVHEGYQVLVAQRHLHSTTNTSFFSLLLNGKGRIKLQK